MTCFYPLSGFIVPNPVGNKKIVVKPYKTLKARFAGQELIDWIPLPCGKCAGCKLDYSVHWSVRLQLEASLYPDEYNHFVTLTYNDDNNPVTLVKRDVQLFIKRLRNVGFNFRYFCAGEYGSHTARPHYHLIMFNLKLNDLKPYSLLHPNGLYISETLNSIWSKGNVIIGKVTEDSIKYTARYCLKKIGGCAERNEQLRKKNIQPEFVIMSRKPGLGADAFDLKWFEWNYIPLNGRKYPINRFYVDMFESKGFSYDVLRNYSAQLSKKRIESRGSMDEYYRNLEAQAVEFEARIKILKERNLSKYGID